MLGAFMLLRRTMLDEIGGFDAGFRMYCEDIDLCYRAAGRAGSAGTCPPPSSTTSTRPRSTSVSPANLWHLQGMVRFVRKHPEALVGRRG